MTPRPASQTCLQIVRGLGLNGCHCGYHIGPRKERTDSPAPVARYHKRNSGPLLYRIDVFVEVPPVECEKQVDQGPGPDSAQTRRRVERAPGARRPRDQGYGSRPNSELELGEARRSRGRAGHAA